MKDSIKYTLSFIWSFFASLYYKLIRIITGKHPGAKMYSGELLVVGQDEVKIKLGEYKPKEVIVEFVGNPEVIPCNPCHDDELEWEIIVDHHHHKKHYELVISWEVSSLRTIKWSVY